MQRLVRTKMPLTVCPLSNLQLRVVPSLARHNLGQLLASGIVATVNSDDPADFGGYINENFTQTFAALGLGHTGGQLAANSLDASFVDSRVRGDLQHRLDGFFETFR